MARAALTPRLRADQNVEWLFILTLSNAGSAALANLLETSKHVVKLESRGEGQWLVPSMSAPAKRWDPDYHPNYAVVRAIWLDRVARMRGGEPVVVVEKSPPNLCRYEALTDAFAAMKTSVFTLSRDPYAVCASWRARYGPESVARDWGYKTAGKRPLDFLELLGRIWIERARLLDAARRKYDAHIRYEDLCANPAATLARIARKIPAVADADPAAAVAVKDHARQPLRNMNDQQIATLAPAEIEAVSAGLRHAPEIVEAFGYAIRR